MWFRLALALGMSVRRTQDEICADEFVEWMAYYQIEPWGERRADLRNGVLCAVMAGLHYPKEGPFDPNEFADYLSTESHQQKRNRMSNEQIASAMNMFTQLHNAGVRRG